MFVYIKCMIKFNNDIIHIYVSVCVCVCVVVLVYVHMQMDVFTMIKSYLFFIIRCI